MGVLKFTSIPFTRGEVEITEHSGSERRLILSSSYLSLSLEEARELSRYLLDLSRIELKNMILNCPGCGKSFIMNRRERAHKKKTCSQRCRKRIQRAKS